MMILSRLMGLTTFLSTVFTDEDISNLQQLRCSSISHRLVLDSVNVSENAVFELLRDLDLKKACSPDARLLKEGVEEIIYSLSRIFQLSLCTGTLPQDWISAHIVPVHKK